MAIKIISDSTCEIEKDVQLALDIEVIPLSVIFDGVSYKDGVDIYKEEFYDRLVKAKELPTTSQVNPDEFKSVFQKHLDNGDEVVGIFISKYISGTYQSAVIAKELIGSEKIYLTDSLSATMGLGLLVREAVKLRDKGLSSAEISAEVAKLADKTEFLAIVNTLKYLQMGGRVSKATALVGGIMGISPLVGVVEGKVTTLGKVKGKKATLEYVQNLLREKPMDMDYPIAFAHVRALDAITELSGEISHFTGCSDYFIDELGATMGTHGGPGALGIAYIRK